MTVGGIKGVIWCHCGGTSDRVVWRVGIGQDGTHHLKTWTGRSTMSTLALFLLLSLGGGVASGTSVWQRPKCFNATDLASLNLPLVAPQRDPDLAPIVVEENNWSSQLLASMVGEVILSEVLGYEVATKTNDDYVMLAYETCGSRIASFSGSYSDLVANSSWHF